MATTLEQNHGATTVSDATHAVHGVPPAQLSKNERFYQFFQAEVTSIQEDIEHLSHSAPVGGERKDAIDHCLANIARLTSEVSDASSDLPAYDQRQYSQALKALREKLDETRAKITPKSRFAFKTPIQKNNSAISLGDLAELNKGKVKPENEDDGTSTPAESEEPSGAVTPLDLLTPGSEPDTLGELPTIGGSASSKDYNAELSRPSTAGIRKPSFSQASRLSITNHKGLHIILPPTAAHATSSGSLTNLERCIVDMSAPTSSSHPSSSPFAALTLKNINKSLIIAGSVAGAAHITSVRDSILVIDARQVRMHDCRNVDVYLRVAGRPIVEDCEGVRVAPLPGVYDTTAGEGEDRPNLWDQVDDFKWLKSEPSPNWSISPENERLPEEVWTKAVPDKEGLGLERVLKKVGIKG